MSGWREVKSNQLKCKINNFLNKWTVSIPSNCYCIILCKCYWFLWYGYSLALGTTNYHIYIFYHNILWLLNFWDCDIFNTIPHPMSNGSSDAKSTNITITHAFLYISQITRKCNVISSKRIKLDSWPFLDIKLSMLSVYCLVLLLFDVSP